LQQGSKIASTNKSRHLEPRREWRAGSQWIENYLRGNLRIRGRLWLNGILTEGRPGRSDTIWGWWKGGITAEVKMVIY
jgi:hypothetical protein